MQQNSLIYKENIPIKKSWGQNFLIDNNTINKIISLINPQNNDTIIEIGPGHGALTDKLCKKCKKIYAIEIDPLLCEKMKEKKIKNIKLFNEDILKWNYNFKKNNGIKIVGNLPYYISSPIIFKFLKYNYWETMTIMVQKEVAERITSNNNTKNFSRISVMCQTFCDIKYNINVSRNSFYPKPKVDSAIITLKKIKRNIEINDFSEFIKKAFSQRRKTLKNNLKKHIKLEKIKEYGQKRPQELTVQDYIKLYEKIYI